MLLDLEKVFANDDEILPFACTMDFSKVEVGGSRPFVSPVSAEGQVKSFADAAEFSAQVTFTLSIPCDRCAELVEKQISYRFSHMLVQRLNDEENDNDSFILVQDKKLDLDTLLYDDILLELPSKFLCRPDCKGLCGACGANLNVKSCDCNKSQVDPRLEVLKNLIN